MGNYFDGDSTNSDQGHNFPASIELQARLHGKFRRNHDLQGVHASQYGDASDQEIASDLFGSLADATGGRREPQTGQEIEQRALVRELGQPGEKGQNQWRTIVAWACLAVYSGNCSVSISGWVAAL